MKIISKIKLHLLTHIPDDVRDYGPLVGEATEVFECFNAVFRSCSILSNHQAPSRDIAIQLGGQDGFKQRISGGWWKTESGDWVQAGLAVREKLFEDPVLRNNLGWAGEVVAAEGLLFLFLLRRSHSIHIPGSIKLCPYVVPKKGPRYRPSKLWRESVASGASNASEFCEDSEKPWFEVKHSVSMKSNDQCLVGSWVFAVVGTTGVTSGRSSVNPPIAGTTICGRIVELLAPTEHSTKGIVAIKVYEMLQERHPVFGMPCLTKGTANGKSLVVVSTEVRPPIYFAFVERDSDSSQNVEFDFNVQHDCKFAGCSATGKRARRQECIISDDVLDDAIEHQDVDRWIINTHSLHNGHLLRLRVRPELISPIRMISAEERQRRHNEVASGLQPGQEKRRKNVADKRAAKKASGAVDLKEGHPVTKSESMADGVEPMDVDIGAASVV